MYHPCNEKWVNNRRNRTVKSRTNLERLDKRKITSYCEYWKKKEKEGKTKREYVRPTRKLHETKICRKNFIKRIKTCVVHIVK